MNTSLHKQSSVTESEAPKLVLFLASVLFSSTLTL